MIVPSLELDDIVEEILEKAKALYPIDESRIYACGFSYGGFMSNLLGNKRPDIFAAVAPCGAPISNGYCEGAVGPEPQTAFDGVPRAIAMNTYMPVMNIYGNLDGFRFPFYNIKTRDDVPASIAVTPKTVVDGINSWARVNHAKEIALEDVMALKDSTTCTVEEKNIGMPLEPGCGGNHPAGRPDPLHRQLEERGRHCAHPHHVQHEYAPLAHSRDVPPGFRVLLPLLPGPRNQGKHLSRINHKSVLCVCLEKACCGLQRAFSNFPGASLRFWA